MVLRESSFAARAGRTRSPPAMALAVTACVLAAALALLNRLVWYGGGSPKPCRSILHRRVETEGDPPQDLVAGLFRKRLAIKGDRLFQLSRPAFSLAKGSKRIAQIGLGRSPNERNTIAGLFRKRLPIHGDRLFQPRCPTLALPKGSERITQISLGLSPIEGHKLAGSRKAVAASSSRAVPFSRSPSERSALPKLI
jgi:hypothetical protein